MTVREAPLLCSSSSLEVRRSEDQRSGAEAVKGPTEARGGSRVGAMRAQSPNQRSSRESLRRPAPVLRSPLGIAAAGWGSEPQPPLTPSKTQRRETVDEGHATSAVVCDIG